MSLKINPSWSQDEKNLVETINRIDDANEMLSAENEHDLIDALIDWFSYLPQLRGPNGNAAKEALHSALNNIIDHKNALEEAMKALGYGGTSTAPSDGHQTDYNPFTPQMQDPLVIDADKDGFISTVSLAESEVYFDITGNGVKTKTSWVKGNDAILVYDENEDGKIDNINEAFGNATTSGFDELRNTIDSNYDNKIDRKDILFNRLQLWHDYDQDGSVDEGELKSLKEEGISSIDLNSVQTNINLEGAVLTEASHYTDTTGNKELAADLELIYMPKVDPTIDAGDVGTIDVDTIFLPQLRGYGYVGNSLLAYNIDSNLKELAQKYAGDISLVANHFDEFVATTIFTCKTFTTNKALHVKIQNSLKGADNEDEIKVA